MDFSARTALTPVRRLIVLLKEVDVLLDAHRFVGRQIAIAEDVAIRLVVGIVGAPVEGPGPASAGNREAFFQFRLKQYKGRERA